MYVSYYNECYNLNCFVYCYVYIVFYLRREYNINIYLNFLVLKKEDYRLYRRVSLWYLYYVL